MTWFPEPPTDDEPPVEGSPVPLRYEDVSQDGRIKLVALPPTLGAAVWRKRLADHPITTMARQQGILGILSRLVIECGEGPISVSRDLTGSGWYQLAHTEDDAGDPQRIILCIWADVFGQRGRTHGPPPEGVGEQIRVGRVFAEHVMTRPFHPPGERRVSRLPAAAGLPEVPEPLYDWKPPSEAGRVPGDATALEPEPSPDTTALVFGLGHTDSNQHVNSLVYPELFEQAALRRLAALGHDTSALLPTFVELAYRKPCFAGDRVRIVLQAFEHQGRLGAAGAYVPEDDPEAKPLTFTRMLF